ncbi:MYOSIN-VIIA-LIKE PROTEIN [Salix purpurea]|uniref:MYOSIN-VIIA-LIKE PROTEIN n=1 Tax=Salix purpurea TaxID=77065 RepID=A0A9Q0VR22_SALPP|nr:MYOSIN-VIIA-LIKE PROTEIN [Salix purpurea]
MKLDVQSLMAQSIRSRRTSFSSTNGNEETPTHPSASFSNGDGYDSDGSNFDTPTPATLSMAIPAELAGAIPLIDKFQVEGFLKLMQKQIQSTGKRGFFSKKSAGPQVREKFTFEDMLCFQKDPIPTSLLKINSDLLGKLFKHTLKRAELRDEIFAQISKQTRNNPDRQYLIKAWELMYLCASTMPPSKEIGGYLSEYVHNVAYGASIDSEVQSLALNTLNALKRSVKAGPRHTIPGREEIEAHLTGRKLTTIVFFLDETFEEITYDMATTVSDAVEELSGIIKLSAFSSFSLFEYCKVVSGSKSSDPGNEEYIGLDDNKYIGDLLAEFKAAKDRSKGEILHCKLIFKKKLFRESDEAVTDPMFVQLSYVQLQHDYIMGNYPVGREDAAQLSALQILVDIGFFGSQESSIDWTSLLERFLPRQIAITRGKREWELDILSRYHSMENLTKDDARQQFLRILRSLPYGNSVFFSVRKIDDPIGLLPGRIILGINKRGVHFFRPVPKEYLHSAELRDIMQFGSSNTAVFFKMRVAGVLHIFQFETKQGEEICVALQTHINDKCTKNALNELSKTIEESQKKSEQLLEELHEKQDQEVKLQEQLEGLKDSLRSQKQNLAEVQCDRDRLKSLCAEKDAAFQVALSEKRSLETRLASLSNLAPEKNAKKDLVGANNQVLHKLQDELKLRKEELHAAEERMQRLANEKILLEQKISRFERKVEEMEVVEKNLEQERQSLKLRVIELERKLEMFARDLATSKSTLAIVNANLASLQNNLKELEELREMKEDIDRKNEQTASILKMQASQLAELEVLYKEEQVLRKTLF